MKVLIFHSDPGHAWLEVSKVELRRVGVSKNEISHYSYKKGPNVYLEEDCDAGIYINALMKKDSLSRDDICIKEIHNEDSPIRNYCYY